MRRSLPFSLFIQSVACVAFDLFLNKHWFDEFFHVVIADCWFCVVWSFVLWAVKHATFYHWCLVCETWLDAVSDFGWFNRRLSSSGVELRAPVPPRLCRCLFVLCLTTCRRTTTLSRVPRPASCSMSETFCKSSAKTTTTGGRRGAGVLRLLNRPALYRLLSCRSGERLVLRLRRPSVTKQVGVWCGLDDWVVVWSLSLLADAVYNARCVQNLYNCL